MKRKPKVNWKAMPAWAKWVAMDADLGWFAYDAKPGQSVYGRWTVKNLVCRADQKNLNRWSGDWRDSLCKRPAKGAKR